MKSTGIVRKIDELGRIVIPKEIRNNLKIHNVDNIEIYVDNETIILKKFSLLKTLDDVSNLLITVLNNNIKKNIIITDTEKVISSTGKIGKIFQNQLLSNNLLNAIDRRENMVETHKKELIVTTESIECTFIIKSILSKGDVVGLFIIISEKENINELDIILSSLAVEFLSKYLDK